MGASASASPSRRRCRRSLVISLSARLADSTATLLTRSAPAAGSTPLAPLAPPPGMLGMDRGAPVDYVPGFNDRRAPINRTEKILAAIPDKFWAAINTYHAGFGSLSACGPDRMTRKTQAQRKQSGQRTTRQQGGSKLLVPLRTRSFVTWWLAQATHPQLRCRSVLHAYLLSKHVNLVSHPH